MQGTSAAIISSESPESAPQSRVRRVFLQELVLLSLKHSQLCALRILPCTSSKTNSSLTSCFVQLTGEHQAGETDHYLVTSLKYLLNSITNFLTAATCTGDWHVCKSWHGNQPVSFPWITRQIRPLTSPRRQSHDNNRRGNYFNKHPTW